MSDFGFWLRAQWDRVSGWALVAIGAVLLVSGFRGVSTATDTVDQISYLVSGGIGAMFVLGVGSTLLLSADIHDDWRKLNRVEQRLDEFEARFDRLERIINADSGNTVAVERSDEHHSDGETLVEVGTAGRGANREAAATIKRTRLMSFAGLSAAGLVFVAGWIRTAGESQAERMTPGVTLALTGALFAVLVGALTTARLRHALEGAKDASLGHWFAQVATADSEVLTVVNGTRADGRQPVVMVDGRNLYHRAGCKATSDRALQTISAAALPGSAVPCGLCEPDRG